jgi:hypothetical protein
VDKRTLLWMLVVFFGASIVFRAIIRATEDQSAGVTIVLELAAMGLIIAALAFFVNRRGRGGS